jgi:hypothetical protein
MPAKEERHFLAMVEIINLNDQYSGPHREIRGLS